MLGFPIRTPSDHSSVDNSPRTIVASHVLHRLLMPRHPPCALTHLTTTRCSHPLCNTQHTTTPQHHRSHHTHTTERVRPPAQEQHQEHTSQVSPQDPTVYEPIPPTSTTKWHQPALSETQRQKCSTQPHPQPLPNRKPLHDQVRNSERRPNLPASRLTPTNLSRVHHQHDGSLERR